MVWEDGGRKAPSYPILVLGKAVLDDFGAVVAKLVGNGLSVIAVGDLSPWTSGIHQNRHQNAVHGDAVPQAGEILVGQGRQFQDRLVGDLLLFRLEHGAPLAEWLEWDYFAGRRR